MNETVNQEESKVFTQDELNAIVGDRLKRERDKYADYDSLREKAQKYEEMEEANKSELEKAKERAQTLEAELNGLKKAESLRILREKVANEAGIPRESLCLLTAEDEESLVKQANALNEFGEKKVKGSYPQVKDAGEVSNTVKTTNAEKFGEWFNVVSN